MAEKVIHSPFSAFVLDALKESRTNLYSVDDLSTDTVLPRSQVEESLQDLIPGFVRVSGVRNRAGSELYAPYDREPSRRERAVTNKNGIIRGIARLYYLNIRRVKTCDL